MKPKRIIILGCGNILFGDDGFGSEVVQYLKENFEIPEDVDVIDAGTGVRNILFALVLNPFKPDKVIIIDAVDIGRTPGEVFEIDISSIPSVKIDDFSMHQVPTSNLLKELKEICGVDIKVICVQVQYIPEEVKPGLSEVVKKAIPVACERIMEELKIL
jgi:coenzyme F420 hydrogenase subunit delta